MAKRPRREARPPRRSCSLRWVAIIWPVPEMTMSGQGTAAGWEVQSAPGADQVGRSAAEPHITASPVFRSK